MNDIEKAKEILNQYNQCHVASLFDKIDKAKQEELAKQVLNIDFHKIVELYDNTKKEIKIKDKEIKPIEYLDKEKMSKEEKVTSGRYIENYLEKRNNIHLIILVLDIRHKPTSDDFFMYDYILKTNLPFMVVTNKADKIAITKVDDAVNTIKEYLGISYTPIYPFSAERKIYTEKVWEEVEKYIK